MSPSFPAFRAVPPRFRRAGVSALRGALCCTVLAVSPAASHAQPASTRPPLTARAGALPVSGDSLTAAQFANLSARLSDGGGYFDTDNLISNEASLLHPLSQLAAGGVRGGAYVGVGPDQNFVYIAAMSPSIAIIVDIRRDNLLHHLLYKALFEASRNRAEYLALWLGRPVPANVLAWSAAPVDSLVSWAARTPATAASREQALRMVRTRVNGYGISLSDADRATIERFHRAFIDDGVALRFTSTGRAPRDYYPTLGALLTERDREGRQRSYLASESAFRVVQSLERRNLVVPVVADLSGGTALPGIASVLRERGETLSVLYTSNVEDYLIRDGRFPAFARAVRALPAQPNAVIIRSWFGGPGTHPLNVPGYYTTQLVQPVREFVRDSTVDRVRRYWELVSRVR